MFKKKIHESSNESIGELTSAFMRAMTRIVKAKMNRASLSDIIRK